MSLIAITAFLISMGSKLSLLNDASKFSFIAQRNCLRLLPQSTHNVDCMGAILCGQKLSSEKFEQELIKTSIIHIFIVSGSHLVLIDYFLSLLKLHFAFRFLLLSLYSFAVGWQPPIVRALLGLVIKFMLRKRKIMIPSDLIVLLTGLFILLLFPEWWTSKSLIMSWCAALALTWIPYFNFKNSTWKVFCSQLVVFSMMSTTIWGFGSLHPLGILFNIALAPIVSLLLLPLAVLAICVHMFVPLFDLAIDFFSAVLPAISEPIQITKTTPNSEFSLWGWLALCHLMSLLLRLKTLQGKDPK